MFKKILKRERMENGQARTMSHGSSMSPYLLGGADGDGLGGRWGSIGGVVGDLWMEYKMK